MNKNINDIEKALLEDERISHFLQGLMNVSEEAAFLEELKSNKELRQRASAQARLIKGMKQTDEELVNAFKRTNKSYIEHLKKELEYRDQGKSVAIATVSKNILDEDEDESPTTNTSSILSIRKFIAAASIILIFFISYKSYDYFDTINLGKEYANTFPITTILRGEANESIENELVTLFENVTNDENLNATIIRLSVLWKTAKQDIYNDYTDYAPYIGWYLAIAYLEDYDKDKARNVLKEMEEMYPEGTALGDWVKKLIIELQ